MQYRKRRTNRDRLLHPNDIPEKEATREHPDLSKAERDEGYRRPLRYKVVRRVSGKVSTLSETVAVAMAINPAAFDRVFCDHCRMNLPVHNFYWEGTTEIVGT